MAWILGLRKNVRRLGHKAKPWQLFGSLLESVSKAAVVCIDATALAPFVSFKDIGKHLETDTGKTFFQANSKFYTISPSEVLWVPYGTMAMPFGLGGTDGIDHLYCVPVFFLSQSSRSSQRPRD